MENQPAQVPPLTPPTQTSSPAAPTGEWPAVPPAPAPIKPAAALVSLDPLVIKTTTVGAPTATPDTAAEAPAAAIAAEADETPTTTMPAGPAPTSTQAPPRARRTARGAAQALGPDESPILQLQRAVRRQQALARGPRQDLFWQPRFAYGSAAIIMFALTVVSLPLWIVLYRITGSAGAEGAGPAVADLVALCMMLLGGFLTGAALWVIIIEMRGRVRMVDTLARTGEREVMVVPAAPEIPVLDSPLDSLIVTERAPSGEPVAWEAGRIPPHIAARVEAQQVSAAATLEASSKLLSSFSSVLRSFGQLPAQVAMLAVALALFVGATVLSLN